jgi:hypothetical protein
MKVSEWALFNQNERYELYKDSELMVNNLNADIARLATENEEQRDLLKAAQASLEEKRNDVKKEQLQIRMVVENQKQDKIMRERKILNMKNGQKVLNEAFAKKNLLETKQRMHDGKIDRDIEASVTKEAKKNEALEKAKEMKHKLIRSENEEL